MAGIEHGVHSGRVSRAVVTPDVEPTERRSVSILRHLGSPERPRTPRERLRSLGKHLVLIGLAVTFVFPLIWMVLTSGKTNLEAIAVPPVWFPQEFLWENYAGAWNAVPFLDWFWNTLVYCLTSVVGVVLSSSLVAYGFSRLRWRGRDTLFYVMVSTMLLPFIVTMVPLFVLFARIGWTDSYLPLVVPTFFGSSIFSTFLLRQFFMTIPESLSEAARIEGASELRIYAQIILPLAKPAVAVVALFQFLGAWNDFLGPLIYLNTPEKFPLALGLNALVGTFTTNWGWLMAASTMVTAPIIILFFLTQRTFVQGITLTGIKG